MPLEKYPTKPGYYWARRHGSRTWDLIAVVYGELPNLRADVWRPVHGGTWINASARDIEEMGPMFAAEPPAIEGLREDWKEEA
jgi:hypothetical protein